MNTKKISKKLIVALLSALFILGIAFPAGFVAFAYSGNDDITADFEGNFKTAVLDLMPYSVPDNVISASVVSEIESLDVSNRNIECLSGIEHFTNLKILIANNNRLTELDLNDFTELTEVRVRNNNLELLTLRNLTNLMILDLSGNRLSDFDVNDSSALQSLNVERNRLTALNVSGFPALRNLDVGRNNLETLILGNHSHMVNLYAHVNQLTELNVNNAPSLRRLVVRDNKLTTINVSNLRELRFLDIERNDLVSIARIIGLESTMISSIIEGESWLSGGERYGFYFRPQNIVIRLPFNDIHHTDWFYDYVLWAYIDNITTGLGGTNLFGPRSPVTRSQFVTFLHRIAGEPVVHATHRFTDVPAGRYFTMPIAWAYRNNITTGIPETTLFEPSQRISREQIVTMLHRHIGGVSPSNALDRFSDRNTVSPWAVDAMRWAANIGIIQGDRGRLLPRNEATRAEAIAMLYRALA